MIYGDKELAYESNGTWSGKTLMCSKFLKKSNCITFKNKTFLFYGHHHDFVDRYGVFNCTLGSVMFTVSHFFFSFVYPGRGILRATKRVFLKTEEDANTHPYTWFILPVC